MDTDIINSGNLDSLMASGDSTSVVSTSGLDVKISLKTGLEEQL